MKNTHLTKVLVLIVLLIKSMMPIYVQAQGPTIQAGAINFGAGNIFSVTAGNGNPTGACVGRQQYTQMNDTSGNPFWICNNNVWKHLPTGTPIDLTPNEAVSSDNSGNLTVLPEKGTSTTSGVTSVAWSEDFNNGVFDPRDTQWAGGIYGTTPAAAIQATFDAAACFTAQKGRNASVIMPPGTFSVGTTARPTLQLGPGIAVIGAPGGSYGSTVLQATWLGNAVFQMLTPYTVATCPNGATNVTDNADGGYISNIFESGCLFVSCSNLPGHSTTAGDGLAQIGFIIGGEHNEIDNLHAYGNLGPGFHIQGVDTTVKGLLFSYSNNAWLVEQKGPAPDTYNPATDGFHGDVELYSVDATNSTIETYGFLVQPGTEAGHLSGVLLGGGNTSASNLFIQLPEIGIQGDGSSFLQRVTNFRIDGSWLEGIYSRNGNVSWLQGLIDGYCLSSAAAAPCDAFISFSGTNTFNNIILTRTNGFGTSYPTGDFCVNDGSSIGRTIADGGLGAIPDTSYACTQGNPYGYRFIYEAPDIPQPNGGTVLTGATPNFLGLKHIIMTNSSATNITAPTGVLVGRDYTISLSTSNDVLVSVANGGNFVTCSGYNIAGPRNGMHFTGTQPASYSPQYLTESCEDNQNVNWHVGAQGYTLPSTNTLPALLTFGSDAVASVPALAAPSVTGIGTAGGPSCYDVKVYVAGGVQANSATCISVTVPASTGPSANVQIAQVLPINSTRYVVYRETTAQSGISPGTIADVTLSAPVTVPTTVNVFDTTSAATSSNVLGANQGVNMTGTYNFSSANFPLHYNSLGIAGQVNINASTGYIYYCVAENSWVRAALTFSASF